MRQPHQWSHELLSFQISGSTTNQHILGKVSAEELGNHRILQSAGVPKGPHPTCGQQEGPPPLPLTTLWHKPSSLGTHTCFSSTHNFFLIGSLLIIAILCRGNKQQLEKKVVFLFPGTLAELSDASHPQLPHGHMLLPARASLPECSAPSVPHEQGTVLVGCLALPRGGSVTV